MLLACLGTSSDASSREGWETFVPGYTPSPLVWPTILPMGSRMKIRALVLVIAVTLGIVAFPSVAAAAPAPSVIATTAHPIGIVEDSVGNVWIADGTNATSSLRGLVVVPAATGTLFGFSVTADTHRP